MSNLRSAILDLATRAYRLHVKTDDGYAGVYRIERYLTLIQEHLDGVMESRLKEKKELEKQKENLLKVIAYVEST